VIKSSIKICPIFVLLAHGFLNLIFDSFLSLEERSRSCVSLLSYLCSFASTSSFARGLNKTKASEFESRYPQAVGKDPDSLKKLAKELAEMFQAWAVRDQCKKRSGGLA
jgi:hypothetical protein